MSPAFKKMRQGLVDRGFLDGEFRVTAEGELYTAAIMQRLRECEAPVADPRKRGTIWAPMRQLQARGRAAA